MSVYKWSETRNYEWHQTHSNGRPVLCGCWNYATNAECQKQLKPNMLVHICYDMSADEDAICLECASALFDVTIDKLLLEYK